MISDRYLVRRLALTAFVVWGALAVMFFAIRLAPGDPAELMLGTTATPEQVEAKRRELGLDQNLLVQFVVFLQKAVTLDFGESIRFGRPAIELVLDRLPITLTIGALALLVAFLLAVPLGVASARRFGSLTDRGIATGSLIAQALPSFWLGIVLILIFSRMLGWLPSAGAASLLHLVLPVITLALPLVGTLARLVRSGLLEVVNESFIRTARSKWLPESTVIYGHALRNTMLPVVTVMGLQAGELLSGMVIVEVVFAVPGLGRLLVDSIAARDYPLVQAAIIVVAAIYALCNLAVDLLYTALDPRVRLTGARS